MPTARDTSAPTPPGDMAPPPPPVTPPWRRGLDSLTTPTGLLLVSVLAVALLPFTSPIRDPDFWWHLRSGQMILDRHALVGTDPFTYTVSSHPWVMHEWGTEVIFAALVAVGGIGAVVLALSLASWSGFLMIFARARLRQPGNGVLALGLMVGVVTGYEIWGPRAQMITFALSCLVLYIYERYLTRGGRIIWALPPIYLIWSNLHSGFVIGLAFAVLIFAADLIGGRVRMPDSAPRQRLGRLLAMVVLCAGVAMINPNGPQILFYAFGTQGSQAQQSLILEWHSPDFHDWEARTFAAMLGALVVMVAINRRIRPRDAALVAATAMLSLQSVRHIALFVAAATPVWVDQAQMLVDRWRSTSSPPGPGPGPGPAPAPPLRLRLVAVTVLVAGILAVYLESRLIPAMNEPVASIGHAESFPVCASRWLRQAPAGLRIFNQYGEGGYLAYSIGDRDRIFIFGDAGLMGDDLLYTYQHVEQADSQWSDVLDRLYPTDLVVFDTNTPLARVLAASPRWAIVYADSHNQIFARRERLSSLHLPPQSQPPLDPRDACTRLGRMPPDTSG